MEMSGRVGIHLPISHLEASVFHIFEIRARSGTWSSSWGATVGLKLSALSSSSSLQLMWAASYVLRKLET